MTTIGTITFHESINYGAILQACALQKTLDEMGCTSEIIDYCNPHRATATLSRFHRIRHFVWLGVRTLLAGRLRQRRTDEFRRRHLRLSPRKFFDARSLHEDPPLYDAYVTGSDQVWNPRNNNGDSSYFLTFAPSGRKRISYAASFGLSMIPHQFVNDYSDYLRQIHSLSVRENEGKQIVKDLIGRDALLVLDPTLLLDREQWNRMASPYQSNRPYILCYYMPGDSLVNSSITNLSRQVSKLTGWNVISIGQKEYMRLHPLRRCIFAAGPSEFLGLFENASFVITNSFHGTAFALIYRIPFLVPCNRFVPLDRALSSRITTLLGTLNLEHRLWPADCRTTFCETLLELDFQDTESILRQEKKKSLDFIRSALKEA